MRLTFPLDAQSKSNPLIEEGSDVPETLRIARRVIYAKVIYAKNSSVLLLGRHQMLIVLLVVFLFSGTSLAQNSEPSSKVSTLNIKQLQSLAIGLKQVLEDLDKYYAALFWERLFER
jgi:hypothetical protein